MLAWAAQSSQHLLEVSSSCTFDAAWVRTPLLCPAADRNGYYLHGWTRQHDALVNQHGQQPLVNRRSQVVWRGRTEDARYPERDALRWGRLWQCTCTVWQPD